MTSRVQKGSQVFRPTKGKARPPPRPSQAHANSPSQHSNPSLPTAPVSQPLLGAEPVENAVLTSIRASRSISPAQEAPLFLESRQSSPDPVHWDSDPPSPGEPSTLVNSTPALPIPPSSDETIVQNLEPDSDADDLQTTPKASSSRQTSRAESVPAIEEGNSSDLRSSESEYEEEGKPKKKRRRLAISEDPEPDPNPPKRKTPKRRTSSTAPTAKKRKRKTSPPPPPFDPSANPGEELDPTALTMAMLCDDTGQGRVSSKAMEVINNHAEWKVRSRAKRAEMKAKAERKKYGRPEEEPEQGSEAPESTPAVILPDPDTLTSPDASSQQDPGDMDYSMGLQHSRFNAQIRIGPNGETIVDETSLVVEREDGEASTEGYAHVVESDLTKFTNSGTFAKKTKGARWSAEETELFYDALQQFGENYELMSMILPGRDRKSIQNKFKSEDKKNTARINHCLKHSRPIDMATLTRLTGKDFSGPVPVIKIPTPPPPPPPPEPSSEGGETAGGSTTQKINKRSRSRSKQPGSLGDGVEIVGTSDTFDPGFAEE